MEIIAAHIIVCLILMGIYLAYRFISELIAHRAENKLNRTSCITGKPYLRP